MGVDSSVTAGGAAVADGVMEPGVPVVAARDVTDVAVGGASRVAVADVGADVTGSIVGPSTPAAEGVAVMVGMVEARMAGSEGIAAAVVHG
jgi:hypothetical protein